MHRPKCRKGLCGLQLGQHPKPFLGAKTGTHRLKMDDKHWSKHRKASQVNLEQCILTPFGTQFFGHTTPHHTTPHHTTPHHTTPHHTTPHHTNTNTNTITSHHIAFQVHVCGTLFLNPTWLVCCIQDPCDSTVPPPPAVAVRASGWHRLAPPVPMLTSDASCPQHYPKGRCRTACPLRALPRHSSKIPCMGKDSVLGHGTVFWYNIQLQQCRLRVKARSCEPVPSGGAQCNNNADVHRRRHHPVECVHGPHVWHAPTHGLTGASREMKMRIVVHFSPSLSISLGPCDPSPPSPGCNIYPFRLQVLGNRIDQFCPCVSHFSYVTRSPNLPLPSSSPTRFDAPAFHRQSRAQCSSRRPCEEGRTRPLQSLQWHLFGTSPFGPWPLVPHETARPPPPPSERTWSTARTTARLWDSRPWRSQTGQVIQGLR